MPKRPEYRIMDWNRAITELQTNLHTNFNILQVQNYQDVRTLFDAIVTIYETKCERAGKVLSASSLYKMQNQAIEIFNLDKKLSRQLKGNISSHVRHVSLYNDLSVKKAPVVNSWFIFQCFTWLRLFLASFSY